MKILQKKSAFLKQIRVRKVKKKNYATLTLGSSVIVMCDEINDLGFTVSSKIEFSSYINNTVARTHARSNVIYKCLIF